MEKRYLFFFVAAAGIVLGNVMLTRWLAPPPKPKPLPEVAEAADGKAPDAKAADAAKAPEQANNAVAAPEGAPAAAAPRNDVAAQFATLGSLDPDSGYRMLVTLTNQGAAVERIELNSPRYHDTNWNDRDGVENESGYLGHLAAANRDGRGVKVQVVGPGTPAEKAGVKVGDVILAIDDQPLLDVTDLRAKLLTTNFGQEIKLAIEGRETPITVKLTSRPVQVVQPEADDPLSFLTTLQSVGKQMIVNDALELPGLTMRTAAWDVLPNAGPDEVAYRWPLPEFGLEVVKRYRLVRAPDEQLKEVDAKAYHLTFNLTIRNTGAAATDVAYRLDGPTGLPTEGSWYAAKISTGASGLRDVVVGQWTGTKVNTVFDAAGEIADKSGTVHRDQYPIAFAGVDAVYFASALLPQKSAPKIAGSPMPCPSVSVTSPRISTRKTKPTSRVA